MTPAACTRRGFLSLPALAAGRAPARLRAGAATSNITLPIGALNGGVIARGGPATHVHDELHVRALALSAGETTIAIAVCDARMIARDVIDRAKRLIQAAAGLPPENILISATHTHAAPAIVGLSREELDIWYEGLVTRRIADGVLRALGNLAPARAGWAFGSLPGEVFNRRWLVKPGTAPPNPFGGRDDTVVMNPGNRENLVKPAGVTDPQVSVLSVQHADGRPLALLGNYSLHYIGGYEAGHVSADYFAIFADRMQQLMGADRMFPPFVGIMSNGTSGDVNNVDFRAPRQKKKPWTRMREVALRVADEAFRACRRIEYQEALTLDVATRELQLGVRRPDAARLAWAEGVVRKIKDPKRLTRPEIYAGEALELARFPASVPVTLQAMRIGGLGIAAVPCEVFAETGVAIKAQSSLEPAFTVELANGYNGYLPTPRQHEWGGYETWPARSAYLEKQAEPRIRAGVLELLDQVARSA